MFRTHENKNIQKKQNIKKQLGVVNTMSLLVISSAMVSGVVGKVLACALLTLVELGGTGDTLSAPVFSQYVTEAQCIAGGTELHYQKDALQNVIPDFSKVGYLAEGVHALPPRSEVPVVHVLHPQKQFHTDTNMEQEYDDTDRIETALAAVAKLNIDPVTHMRGALLLTAGEYRISRSLMWNVSNVVLRGQPETQSSPPTVLRATTLTPYNMVLMSGTRYRRTGPPANLTDDYVPTGATFFNINLEQLEAANNHFEVGDQVKIVWQVSDKWVSLIGMDHVCDGAGDRKCYNWDSKNIRFQFMRKIVYIVGSTLYINIPLVMEMDIAGGMGWGHVLKYVYPNRVQFAGVEDIHFYSDYQLSQPNDHAKTALDVRTVENVYVRDVTCKFFSGSCVRINDHGTFITVTRSQYLSPVSVITGGFRYPWNVDGGMVLVSDCYSEHARHESALGSRAIGPNVFVRNVAVNTYSDTGPHQRYAVGALFDNMAIGAYSAENRKYAGTGHGWAGGNIVYWNVNGTKLSIQSPPGSANYAIGCRFTSLKYKMDNATFESVGVPVYPASLYESQVNFRRNSKCYTPHITGGWTLATTLKKSVCTD